MYSQGYLYTKGSQLLVSGQPLSIGAMFPNASWTAPAGRPGTPETVHAQLSYHMSSSSLVSPLVHSLTSSSLTQARDSTPPLALRPSPFPLHAQVTNHMSPGSSLPPHALVQTLPFSCLYSLRRLRMSLPASRISGVFNLPGSQPTGSAISLHFPPPSNPTPATYTVCSGPSGKKIISPTL